jgi:Cap4 SAVED domain
MATTTSIRKFRVRTLSAAATVQEVDLDFALAAMRRDYSNLSSRIRTLTHSVVCECEGVQLRLHFPAFRQGSATVHELVEAISLYLMPFCMPRSEVNQLDKQYGTIKVDDFRLKHAQLSEKARSLFIRANRATNRSGEAGELLLYLLTEWILGAPQIIAKMSLKTNREMPVHGSDGVHVRYDASNSRLILYWGESKLYGDVGDAIAAAVKSVTEALNPEKMQHEIDLIQRNISFSGLDDKSKDALLRHLDPFDDTYNNRHDVITCLIGFDFDAYTSITAKDGDDAEKHFSALAQAKLEKLAPTLAAALKKAKLDNQPIELFFFPVPAVQDLRDIFQTKIGWQP